MPSGWTAEELARITGGRWAALPFPPPRTDRLTYIVKGSAGVGPGALLVATDEADWPTLRRKRSGQWRYSYDTLTRYAFESRATGLMSSVALPDAPLPVLQVENSRHALWRVAEAARERFTGSVVAITGTVGKSTTRTMLRQILSSSAAAIASPGNWNTLDSVAMTMASTPRDVDFAILETAQAGLSGKDGITSADLVRPHYAIVTAIGHGDVAQFPTLDDTVEAKSQIIRHLEPGGVAIVNKDTSMSGRLLSEAAMHADQTITFGEQSGADVQLRAWRFTGEDCVAEISVFGENAEVVLPAPGRGIALNVLATIGALRAMNLNWREFAPEIAKASPGKRVLEFHRVSLGDQGRALVIDDSHNAEELSMIAAFEVMKKASSPEGRRIAALGNIVKLAHASEEIHGRLADPLVAAGVDLVFTVGEGMSRLRENIPGNVTGPHCDSPEEMASLIVEEIRDGDVVLVKGSRRDTGFGRVVPKVLKVLGKRST